MSSCSGRLALTADAFLSAALGAQWQWISNPGMGDAFVQLGTGVNGCCLRSGRDLVAFSAFPTVGS